MYLASETNMRFLVTRHPGALQWICDHGVVFDEHLAHLDMARVLPGDTVIGNLSVHQAAAICERGAQYLHLCIDVPAELRGQELSAEQLRALGATLQSFSVEKKFELSES